MHTYIIIHTDMQTCRHVGVHTYMHACMHAYIHAYSHMYSFLLHISACIYGMYDIAQGDAATDDARPVCVSQLHVYDATDGKKDLFVSEKARK